MREFFKRADKETLGGGLFGLVAIAAIVTEMFLADFSAESIVAAVKDISGTVVAIMVFFVAAKHILKQIRETKTFDERLEKAINDWQTEHKNMIVRKEQYDYEKTGEPATCYSLGLKTNISDFYNHAQSNNTGWFLRMPILKKENYQKDEIVLKFHLNKGTFFEGMDMTKEELAAGFQHLNGLFREFIQSSFPEKVVASGKNQDIIVRIQKPIETEEDIALLVSVINTMYNAYLVAANMKH